jgi:hypothetical protein
MFSGSRSAQLGDRSGAGDSAEAEDGPERVIDAPELLTGEVTGEIAEPAHVYCAELFDEDPCGISGYLDLRPKRGRPRAARGGSYQHDRTREQLVGLDDDAKAIAVLLVTDALGELESVDVTPEHVATP